MKIETVTCTVSVGGELSMEYEVESSELGKSKTCHIVAEESEPFSFTIDLTSDAKNKNKQFQYKIYVDRELTNNAYVHVGTNTHTPCVVGTTNIRTPKSGGMYEQRPFKFGKCLTVETSGADIEKRAEVLKEIGTFKVGPYSP